MHHKTDTIQFYLIVQFIVVSGLFQYIKSARKSKNIDKTILSLKSVEKYEYQDWA